MFLVSLPMQLYQKTGYFFKVIYFTEIKMKLPDRTCNVDVKDVCPNRIILRVVMTRQGGAGIKNSWYYWKCQIIQGDPRNLLPIDNFLGVNTAKLTKVWIYPTSKTASPHLKSDFDYSYTMCSEIAIKFSKNGKNGFVRFSFFFPDELNWFNARKNVSKEL